MMQSTQNRTASWLDEHSPLLTRAGLLLTGMMSWKGATLLWESGSGTSSSLTIVLMLATYLVGFALFIAAIAHSKQRALSLLIPPALLLVLACYAQNYYQLQLENGVHTADVKLYMDYAARVLRAGENPYGADLIDAFRINRAPFNLTTTLIDGDVTGRLAYPALSFLPFVPLQWLGIPADWLYPLLFLALLVLLYEGAPLSLRPLILLPLFFDSRYLYYTLGGVSDVGWALLLVAMLRTWRRPRWRGVFYGLACAFKHQPWIIGPFLLIRLWHEHTDRNPRDRLRVLMRFAAWAALAFSAVNLPFFLWSPSAWVAGVFEPVVAPMITFGQGLSALTMYGLVVIPKPLYSLLMIATLGMLLWTYHRHYAQLRLLVWLAPGLMLWFSHRSLTSYWYFFIIPLLYQFVRELVPSATSKAETRWSNENPRPHWRPTLSLFGGWAALVMIVIIVAGTSTSSLKLHVLAPIELTGNHIKRLRLELKNGSRRIISPRFTVQANGQPPFFWRIERGPAHLAAGRTAHYTISTSASYASFDLRRGARITALHAGSTSLRQTILLTPDRSYIYPDTIPNGDYKFWLQLDHPAAHPAFWGIIHNPQGSGNIQFQKPHGKGKPPTALEFILTDHPPVCSLALNTYLALPQSPLELWVHRPRGSNLFPDPALLYGLRVLIDHRYALVLFGDRKMRGTVAGIPYLMLPAAVGRWTRQRLLLPEVLAKLGLTPLPRRVALPRFEHLDIPTVPMNLELYFARRRSQASVKRALFGPIHSVSDRPSIERLFAARGRKLAPHAWRGSFDLELRNYEKARIEIQRAATLSPRNATLYLNLGEAQFWRRSWHAALAAYTRAVELDPKLALAFKGIGWCHYNLGELEEALLAWHQARKLLKSRQSPRDKSHLADTLKGIGLTLLRQGRCERASQALQQARKLSPSIVLPHDVLRGCRATTRPATRPQP